MKKLLSACGQLLVCLLYIGLCAALLLFSGAVREGVQAGLTASAEVVIPSLFLFMAIAGIIAQSRAGELISRPLAPLTRRLLKLPPCMGQAVLLSAIGGYPVGAKTIAILLEQGKLSREDAERAICFCCHAGPSFAITAVGARLLGSARAGCLLLIVHLLCSLLTGALLSLRLPAPPRQPGRAQGLPFGEAFVSGVSGATFSMLGICAYVVLFSALGALLKASGLCALIAGILSRLLPLPGKEETVSVLLLGLLEVTTGCMAAAALPGRLPLLLIPFFLSFAGLSIFFQIRSTLQPYRLRFHRFFLFRLLHGVLTAAVCYPLLSRPIRSPVAAFHSSAVPIPYRTPGTPHTLTLLLCVCAMALWSLTPESGGKISQDGEKSECVPKKRIKRW